MPQIDKIQLLENKRIRMTSGEKKDWHFPIVDMVGIGF